MPGGPPYEIIDGVRRAKATLLAGQSLIRARVFAADGKQIREFDCPLDELRSPHKPSIRLRTLADQLRWSRVVEGASRPQSPFPPIEIVAGDRGVTIDQITFS